MTPLKLKPMQNQKARGFTLIELMIAVVVVGVLAAAAMPSFSSFIAAQRIKTTSFDLMSTMIFARSEAMKRNNIVNVSYVAASNEIIVAVTNAVTSVTTTLKQQSLPRSVQIICTGICGASMDFNANGRLVSTYGPLEIGEAVTADKDKRCISIDLSGRPNSKKGAC